MSWKFKKNSMKRRRFIKTLPFDNFDDYLIELYRLKDFIGQQTHLQIVGEKSYLEFDQELLSYTLMLEVIGVPYNSDRKRPVLLDIATVEVLVYKILDIDLFGIDLPKLLNISEQILVVLEKKGALKIPIFQIVLENEKIELHFFSQKDYIQNLL